MGELPEQSLERRCAPPRAFGGGKRVRMLGRVDEFRTTVLADADAGLRCFDPSAADALPRFHGVEHEHTRVSRVVAILGACGALLRGGVLGDPASLTRIKRSRRQRAPIRTR